MNEPKDALVGCIAYLHEKTGLPTSNDVPADRTALESMLVVNRTGGGRTKFLDRPGLTVDCYAQTGAAAYALACEVAELMDEWPDDSLWVSSVTCGSIYRNEWTGGAPCWSATFTLVVNR